MSIDELAEAAKLVSDHINEVADVAEDAARFREVRATIYVNAIHGLGCTEEEATAYADGTSEKTFVQALIERFEGVNATDQAERIADLEGERDRWKDNCQSATGTIGVIRAMIGEMFGATASIESQDATLLRGPEPKHDGEAILEALQRVQSALETNRNALLTPTPQEAAKVLLTEWIDHGEGVQGELSRYERGGDGCMYPSIDGTWVDFKAVESALRTISEDSHE
ncbi:hypothetical protein [Sulfitobacter sp. R18_1]|uniref:hypothetical protein n=1 Tax=Sulfitobacter sp. R18_1 TaxID=2821104 RepID=UPI001AD9E559|nr:hypothetical protein [Sulfitobacter sp. R18_1]MBO9430571.1 hypothetical protein [Sulfitobacter sp. R18_1]